MVFFIWIATQFRSFLKIYLNNFRQSTQLSSLIIAAKNLSNATECFLLTFCFNVHIGLFQLALRAIWNNLSKHIFLTTLNLDVLDEFKSNEVAAKLSHISHKMNYLLVGTILVFRQRLNSDQRGKNSEKP